VTTAGLRQVSRRRATTPARQSNAEDRHPGAGVRQTRLKSFWFGGEAGWHNRRSMYSGANRLLQLFGDEGRQQLGPLATEPGDVIITDTFCGWFVRRSLADRAGWAGPFTEFDAALHSARRLARLGMVRAWLHKGRGQYLRIPLDDSPYSPR